MRSLDFWPLRRYAGLMAQKGYLILVVGGIALGMMAILAGVATGERSHRDAPAAVTDTAGASSGAGNLVPLY